MKTNVILLFSFIFMTVLPAWGMNYQILAEQARWKLLVSDQTHKLADLQSTSFATNFLKHLSELDSDIETVLGISIKDKSFEIVILSPQELSVIVQGITIDLLAYTERGSNRIYLSSDLGLTQAAVYSVMHELYHLIGSEYDELWINEGFAELFASLMTQFEPLRSEKKFLLFNSPRSLRQNEKLNYIDVDYGQSYLFLKYLYNSICNKNFIKTQMEMSKLLYSNEDFKQTFVNFSEYLISNENVISSEYIMNTQYLIQSENVIQSENSKGTDSKMKQRKMINHDKLGQLPPYSFAVIDVSNEFKLQKPINLKTESFIKKTLLIVTVNGERLSYDLNSSVKFDRRMFIKSATLLLVNTADLNVEYSVFNQSL